MNKYIKNYILSITNTLATMLYPIITFSYVSRVLGPQKLGIIDFAQSYGYYFLHLASFGINSYAIREVSRVRGDREKVEKISNEIFNLNFFFSVISTIIYFCGIFFAPNFRENFIVFVIYSIVILSNFLSLDWFLQSFDDYFFFVIRNLIIRVFSIFAVFVLIKQEDDFIIYMIITCIVEMGTKFSNLLYIRKHYVKLKIKKIYLNFSAHIKYMRVLFVFRLVNGISANLDKLMIGFMLTYAGVGIYSAGVKIVLMVSTLIETVGIVLFPKINISATVSQQEYYKNLKINYDIIVLMGIPMVVVMCLVSGRLIPLFAGSQYMDAIMVSRIMSIIILLGPMADMLGSKILLVYKKDNQLLLCSSIVALANIVLNYIFIPIWGINGAAVASAICYVIAVTLRYFFSYKIVKFMLFSKSMIKYTLFTVPFVVLYIIFHKQIDTNNLWMFVYMGVCILIYFIELIISKDYYVKMIICRVFRKENI